MFEAAKTVIAILTEQAAYLLCVVAMVYMKAVVCASGFGWGPSANFAQPFLLDIHLIVLFWGDAIGFLQVALAFNELSLWPLLISTARISRFFWVFTPPIFLFLSVAWCAIGNHLRPVPTAVTSETGNLFPFLAACADFITIPRGVFHRHVATLQNALGAVNEH
jgi:hypothetical protein